ncbi:hypothetical protein [Qaidamihabitans albus]
MYDRQTESEWPQILGTAIRGKRLTPVHRALALPPRHRGHHHLAIRPVGR